MSRRSSLAAAIVSVCMLVYGATAHAASSIITPPLQDSSGKDVTCLVLNTGTKTAAGVHIEVIRADGVVLADETNDIPAGQFVGIPGATGIGAYCRVSNISKSHARVTVCVRDSTGSCITALSVP
jgi:hypothetical protein